ncbi:MAG: hypothetical protein JSU65_02115 [Candidatus Zixiibacteriota bacterium]|nr:MAG: hypothetical protein JSU65_02115 [candidate division Zixibacteria bacterium]
MKSMLKLVLLGLLIGGCSGGFQYVTEETRTGGYSGNWKVTITAEGRWEGTFGAKDRTLKGDGNMVIFLPDGAESYCITLKKLFKDGTLTAQITGPNYRGDLISTGETHGIIRDCTE